MNTKVAQLLAAPVLRTGGQIAPVVPQTWQDAVSIAGALVRAEMVPRHFAGSVEKTTVAILAGLEVGMPPVTAVQSIYIINNMPCLFGDGLIGVVRASGLLEDIEERMEFDEKGIPTLAVCRVKRKGEKTWTEHVLTRAQAQRAGWWSKAGPWTQTPQRMMQLRPRSWCLRDKFADVLKGLRSAEEAEDMVDITPHASATTVPAEPRRSDFQADAPSAQPAAEAPQAAAGSNAGEPPPPTEVPESPGPQVTDVQVDDTPPEHAKEGQKLEFPAYATSRPFIDFAEDFLPKTNAEGARQFLEFYGKTLERMEGESGTSATREAASWIRATAKEIIEPPEGKKA